MTAQNQPSTIFGSNLVDAHVVRICTCTYIFDSKSDWNSMPWKVPFDHSGYRFVHYIDVTWALGSLRSLLHSLFRLTTKKRGPHIMTRPAWYPIYYFGQVFGNGSAQFSVYDWGSFQPIRKNVIEISQLLQPKKNGHYFSDDIFKCIPLNENLWILKFQWNMFRRI